MSFHNLNEEDFGSDDSSDEDYVPCEGGNLVSEEENSGEDESLSLPDDDGEDGKRGKKRKKVTTKRNKKQKVSKIEDIATEKDETTEKAEVEKVGASEELNKKRVDTLWADFLKDVGGSTKNSKEGSTEVTTTTTSSQKQEKVTIVKEYDFAGETVRISTQVDSSSKEAKEEEKRKSLPVAPQPQVVPSASTSTPSPSFGIKKPSAGLTGLLDKLQKKAKDDNIGKIEIGLVEL